MTVCAFRSGSDGGYVGICRCCVGRLVDGHRRCNFSFGGFNERICRRLVGLLGSDTCAKTVSAFQEVIQTLVDLEKRLVRD